MSKHQWRLRPGAIVSITVNPTAQRPVTITCHDHPYVYEFAWVATETGPTITDLRITSSDNTPVTTAGLRRIDAERLAGAAALADTPGWAANTAAIAAAVTAAAAQIDPDTLIAAHLAELQSLGLDAAAEDLRRTVAEQGAAAVLADMHTSVGTWRIPTDAPQAWANSLDSQTAARLHHRATGQKKHPPPEFYAAVADAVRTANALGRPEYAAIAERAAAWGRDNPTRDTIRRWKRRAEAEGYLQPAQKPSPNTTGDSNE